MIRSIKRPIQLLFFIAITSGIVLLISATRSNRALSDDISQLEAELGRMPIDDKNKVHIVAIENPAVPPEVATHVGRVWQFRCYLPAGYDFSRFSGGGRVTDQGVSFQGGFSSGSSSPNPKPSHKLFTIGLCEKGDRVECFSTFGDSSSTTSWNGLSAVNLKEGDWVIKTLATPGGPAQSFDRNTMLPMLKVYDPSTAEAKQINGESVTTYQGGLLVLCPKSREAEFEELRKGERPDNFDAAWIVEGRRQ